MMSVPSRRTLLCAAVLAAAPLAGHAQQGQGDPLYRYQWHLMSYGQAVLGDTRPAFGMDLGIDDLHDYNIRGKGVVVSVVDHGIEIAHPDLAANMVANGSWNFVDASHDTSGSFEAHGNAVGGIVAAVGWNGIGGRGVAPAAKLKSFNFLDSQGDDAEQQYAWWAGAEAKDVQVSNNSWGYTVPIQSFAISENEIAAFERDMTALRNGLGTVYVKAAGNGFGYVGDGDNICAQATLNAGVGCDQSIWDTSSNLFNVMTIAAVNAAGRRSSYSTPGASLWVSGFGGESGWERQTLLTQTDEADLADLSADTFDPAIVTTDLIGCARGYNTNAVDPVVYWRDFNLNRLESDQSAIDNTCNYTGTMNGTSSAAPMVSGVAALMLQANPKLSYRDVKYILATTARRVDPEQAAVVDANAVTLAPGWTVNAAGRAFSNWYGFGLVDATLAVTRAQGFKSLPALVDSGWQAAQLAAPVAIGGRGAPARIAIPIGPGVRNIESVQIGLGTDYVHGGNLNAARATPLLVTLTSPGGTRAYVLPARAGYVGRNRALSIPFASVNAFLDEPGNGTWTLEVTDVGRGRNAASQGNVTSFKIRVLGH